MTTDPAATIAYRPIRTPGSTTDRAPIEAPSSMTTPSAVQSASLLSSPSGVLERGYRSLVSTTAGPMNTSLPIRDGLNSSALVWTFTRSPMMTSSSM